MKAGTASEGVVSIDQREGRPLVQRPHERIGDPDREIEIRELIGTILGVDEFEDVRMIDRRYSRT